MCSARILAPLLTFAALALISTPSLAKKQAASALDPDRFRSTVDRTRYERSARTIKDLETGLLISAVGLEAGPFEGTPEARARAFLAEHGLPYGIGPAADDLALLVVKEGLWADHVRFQQTIGETPILEAIVVVTVRREDGRVVSVQSTYVPEIAARVGAPALSGADARDIAVSHLAATETRIGDEKLSLAYVSENGSATLVHRVVVPAEDPLGDWEVLVDASNGRIVRTRDMAVYVDGSGLVFDPDPLTTANKDYGQPGYVDGGDAATPELDAERVTRTLKDITLSGGTHRLEGPHCHLLNFESPNIQPVTSVDPDGFVFDRFEDGFEDVNVYWGIDFSQRWIQSLGFTNIQNNPIQCDPHGLSGADNSHYIPSSNRLAWGDGGVDDAEDQDVVWHEYGHAIQFGSNPNWGGGDQDAMGEGFGDYWAGSHSAAVESYRDNWVFNWDGHNPFWNGRVLDYTATYPLGLSGFIHTDGQMWSSTLMQAWRETCREHIDRVTLDHHFAQGALALFPQAAALWVQSDQNVHEGLNVDTYVHFATARGFFLPTDYDMPVIAHTPLMDTADQGPFTVTATITSEEGATITAAEIRYGSGGLENIDQVAAMTPTASPDEWSGQIPPIGEGVTIYYFIVATTDEDLKATDPRPAPCGDAHSFFVEGLVAVPEAVAGRNVLEPVRPNPFNPATRITYSLAEAGHVRLAIFDASGALVRTLVDRVQAADVFRAAWDGRDDAGRGIGSGVYAVRIEGPAGFSESRKLVLLK